MANVVIAGMQWGDEGKGKIVDLLCPAFDAVVRYQGGHNAGHTVKFGDRHFSLHLIPSGICHPGLACVLGNGMVIAPDAFLAELDKLHQAGIDTADRLWVSDRATLLLPLHAQLDQAREKARGAQAIGTTSRGIGPAYETKAGRIGLRLGDLAHPRLAERLDPLARHLGAEIERLGGEPPAPTGELLELCGRWARALMPFLDTTEHRLHRWLNQGKSLLFEGAQGALLDLDFGTFPYVTSSSASTGGASTGSGVPPTALDGVLGVVKAYTSRVGGGPFPTELGDATGEYLRQRGNEYGTTTGRPRRCGWFDAVAVRFARRLNGTTALALTKLDVLDPMDEIKIATAYRVDGRVLDEFPSSAEVLERVEPVYTTVPGWKSDTVGALHYDHLPRAARDYVDLIEREVGVPVTLVSTGPRREETILREHPLLERLLGSTGEAAVRAVQGVA
jgi:adenylosuccinate synthase